MTTSLAARVRVLRLPGGEPQPTDFGYARDDLDLIGAREYRAHRALDGAAKGT